MEPDCLDNAKDPWASRKAAAALDDCSIPQLQVGSHTQHVSLRLSEIVIPGCWPWQLNMEKSFQIANCQNQILDLQTAQICNRIQLRCKTYETTLQ